MSKNFDQTGREICNIKPEAPKRSTLSRLVSLALPSASIKAYKSMARPFLDRRMKSLSLEDTVRNFSTAPAHPAQDAPAQDAPKIKHETPQTTALRRHILKSFCADALTSEERSALFNEVFSFTEDEANGVLNQTLHIHDHLLIVSSPISRNFSEYQTESHYSFYSPQNLLQSTIKRIGSVLESQDIRENPTFILLDADFAKEICDLPTRPKEGENRIISCETITFLIERGDCAYGHDVSGLEMITQAMNKSGITFVAKSARFIGAIAPDTNELDAVAQDINIERMRLYADRLNFVDLNIGGNVTLPYFKSKCLSPESGTLSNALPSKIDTFNLSNGNAAAAYIPVRYGLQSVVLINCSVSGGIGFPAQEQELQHDGYIIPIKPNHDHNTFMNLHFRTDIIATGNDFERGNIWCATLEQSGSTGYAQNGVKRFHRKAVDLSGNDALKALSDFPANKSTDINLDYFESHRGVILFNTHLREIYLQPTCTKYVTCNLSQSLENKA